MLNLLYESIEQLAKEKGIDPKIIVTAVEDALVVAARKYYKTNEDLVAKFDEQSGRMSVYSVKKVVEEVANPIKEISVGEARKLKRDAQLDEEIQFQKPIDVLGRIAAQTAKQVIFQKVREAERDNVFNEYSNRVGELLNCTVKRFENGDVIVDLGKTEGVIPKREQSRLEKFAFGERIRAVIVRVDKSSKLPQVVLSRADPQLVVRLFEMEVPEIYDNTVVVKGCVREAGERTKIAVLSKDRDVDAVGACVGMKGLRVQAVIRELRGEKIDIIEYSDEIVTFATHGLSPARVSRVGILDTEDRQLEVIVEDTQLSLAIGKKGQNVRLASKLVGWHIDVKSEEEKRHEVESQMAEMAYAQTSIADLKGLTPKLVAKLRESSINTVEDLGNQTPEQLMQIPGIGEKMVEKIQVAVDEFYDALKQVESEEAAAQEPEPTLDLLGPDTSEEEAEAEESKASDEEAGGTVAEEGPTVEQTDEAPAETVGIGNNSDSDSEEGSPQKPKEEEVL
ncbi:MAG: transcription termination factor NusA [Acidobacteriia bacterium]|nr:transcription termination factor NusA [Terriglobia bacterium]